MISGFAPSQLYIRSTTLSKFSVLLFIDATAIGNGTGGSMANLRQALH